MRLRELRIFVFFCVPASSWPKERCERRAAAARSVVGRCRRRPRSQRSSGTVGAPARFCCVRGGGPARGRTHAPFVCVSWSCAASRVCPQRCPTTPRRALTWHRACDRRGAHGACDSFQRRCAAVARTRLPSRSALTAPALASAAACAAGIAHARLAAAHPAPALQMHMPRLACRASRASPGPLLFGCRSQVQQEGMHGAGSAGREQ